MSEARLKVILLRHTPNPEETVAMAAKLCYSPSDITSLKKKIETKDQKTFVERLMKMGHMSPIEHSSFTFAVEGISRACSHQLVRHRLASYSQQSQRYVSEEAGFDYLIPETIKKTGIKKYFENVMAEAQKAYNHIVQKLNENGVKGGGESGRQVCPAERGRDEDHCDHECAGTPSFLTRDAATGPNGRSGPWLRRCTVL
jgi:thymidylate synthase (FAD)